MLLRMFISSARRFRPSRGASPATLLAVVLGCVSESWSAVSFESREDARGCFVLCSRVYPGCTRVGTSACLLSLRHPSPTSSRRHCWSVAREGALRVQMRVLLTPNFLNPFILSSWSCISTSSWAEASAVEGSELRPLLLRAMLPVGPSRRALLVQMLAGYCANGGAVSRTVGACRRW